MAGKTSTKVKILIVEDDQFTQDFIKEITEEAGHEALVASSGEEAMAKIHNNTDIRLVLLDIMLPGRSGWDIFMEIRRDSSDIKVIFISAVEVSDERRRALIEKEGLIDYINKPFTQERLLGVIKKTAGLK